MAVDNIRIVSESRMYKWHFMNYRTKTIKFLVRVCQHSCMCYNRWGVEDIINAFAAQRFGIDSAGST